MDIEFYNKKLAKKYLLNIINTLNTAEQILKPSCKHLEVTITFVNKLKIKRLNKQQRNVNRVTDVLSFPTLLEDKIEPIEKKISKTAYPFDINPQTGNIMLGDIVVCVSRCKWQARKYHNTYTREICYLCTHGLLHLLGYDHINEIDKKLMREKEELVMNEIGLSR